MVELELKSMVRPKKFRSYKGETGVVAENVINRQFEASRPHEKWTTDVTEFKVAGKKVYLSPVMDLYNAEIIAWEADTRPTFALVEDMLRKAFARLKRGATPILHSDQGWHYQMKAYQTSLAKHKLRQSMSRKGNCLDNAPMESFFAVLKTEFFYPNKFRSVEQFKQELAKYIRYYNYDRIKMKLGGLSPVRFRTQALPAGA